MSDVAKPKRGLASAIGLVAIGFVLGAIVGGWVSLQLMVQATLADQDAFVRGMAIQNRRDAPPTPPASPPP